MRKIVFFLTALFLPLTAAQAGDNDFFTTIYKEAKKSAHEVPLKRMSVQLGVATGDIDDLLSGSLNEKTMINLCKTNDRAALVGCLQEIYRLYLFEKSIAQIENYEKELAYAAELWANGTLVDGSFDLVVDLNIIDVLYFGSTAQIPVARFFDPFATAPAYNTPGNGDGGDSTGGNGSDNGDGNGNGEETDDSDGNDEGDSGGDADGDSADDGENYADQACGDPEAVPLDGTSGALASGAGSAAGSDWRERRDLRNLHDFGRNSGLLSGYLGGEYPALSVLDDIRCPGTLYQMFGHSYCIPKFCNDVICITVELIDDDNATEGGSGGSASASGGDTVNDENCVQCLIKGGLKALDEAYRQKERLSPTQNTPVHWDIRNWTLGDFRLETTLATKPAPAASHQTPDQQNTVAQEIRLIQTASFPSGGSFAADNDTNKLLNNRQMLDLILSADCDSFLNRIPYPAEREALMTTCNEGRAALSSPLLRKEYIKYFREEILNKLARELRTEYWREMQQQFNEFSGMVQAINSLFANLMTAEEISKKMVNCQTTQP